MFFHRRVRGFAFHHCKFHFDSMYGGLDTPYGSNSMNQLKTIDDHLEAKTIHFLSIGMLAND